MEPENQIEKEDAFNDLMATYSPEDNKLRLYIGRVPRDEYEKLRAEGWKALHKQREAGGGDFVATWTPERRDTALEYAGVILDEDMGPAERAADRAERFSGYREKRFTEATGGADRYDAGPSAYGFQSAAKAERSVRRHDRLAARSVDSWDKAEYWQQRTAGVIGHALYVSSPSVRMGRIKTLEADLRRSRPGGQWHTHLTLRLVYEKQMLEAQGGRAADVEIVEGGFIGSRQIWKVNKSSVTGRVVSVFVIGPKVKGYCYQVQDVTGADFSLHQIETERLPKDAYRAPTAEAIANLEKIKADLKAGRPKAETIPIVNPTDADAERLQAIWNKANANFFHHHYHGQPLPTVARLTQAQYSENSGGTYSKCETVYLTGGGNEKKTHYMRREADCPVVAKVRKFRNSVVILTDKPQKPFAANVWHDPRPGIVAKLEANFSALESALRGDAENGRGGWLPEDGTPQREIMGQACIVGLCFISSMSQFGFTDSGHIWAKAQREKAGTFELEAETVKA